MITLRKIVAAAAVIALVASMVWQISRGSCPVP